MIDFNVVKKIHFIGIKGWGTSALAQLLAQEGYEVCGSDSPEYFRTQDLLARNQKIRIEEFGEHIHEGVDAVIYSTAYLKHPELDDAKKKELPLSSYPEALTPFFNKRKGIAVSGTHGKTTTTGWIAYVLHTLGYDPTAIVGSRIKQFESNVLVGSSDVFVLEADEYQKKLELYSPALAVVTSIEYDHPDFFKSYEEYENVFVEFALKTFEKGSVIACWEDKGVRHALSNRLQKCIRYGFDHSLDYYADDITETKEGMSFSLIEQGREKEVVRIQLMGRHNVLNALAVYAACRQFGITDTKKICKALGDFEGTARRSEYRTPIGHTIVIDDYGHHPTEVRATLSSILKRYPHKKIWCVFWPHTYSRTQELFDDFVKSFSDVEKVVFIDIYGSAREQVGTVHSKDLVKAMNDRNAGHALYGGSVQGAAELIKKNLSSIDVLVTMGAEDLWKTWETLLL